MVKRENRPLKTVSIQVSSAGVSFSTLDTTRRQITGIAAFQQPAFSPAALEQALAEHALLEDDIQAVLLNQNHLQFTLVPTAFYDKARARALLGHSTQLLDQQAIRTDDLQAIGLHVLYVDRLSPPPKSLPAPRQSHFLSAFLRFVLKTGQLSEAACVFAHQYQNLLSVLVFRDANLLLANTYEAHNAADTVYYLLALFDNFSLSHKNQPLTLSGELSSERGLPKPSLQTYFGALRFLSGFRNTIHPEESAKPLGLIQTHQILLE